MSVVIRPNTGPGVGLGHVVRCLAIADALRLQNVASVFVLSADADAASAFVASHGYETRSSGETCASDADATALIAMCKAASDLVVLDGYAFDDEYERRLALAGVSIVAMDDYNHARHDAARMIINGNLHYCNPSRYAHIAETTSLLLGVSFAPLRPALVQMRRRPDTVHEVSNIVVTFGGHDPRGSLVPVLEALRVLVPDVRISATVVGTAEYVGALRARFPSVAWITDPVMLPGIMAAADLAVAASGMTPYELACLGIPAVLLPATEIQLPDAEAFALAGTAISLGLTKEFPLRSFSAAVTALAACPRRRMLMSHKGRALVDGLGANRIAQQVLACFGQNLGTELVQWH
jgi:UDP-2,4-diacetamido-2,4,6-trideoxy-beta-L-altropyranose hydrolase